LKYGISKQDIVAELVKLENELEAGYAPAAPVDDVEQPERTALGTMGDVGISALKSVIQAPEAIQGLIDIPTGGRFGKITSEYIGYKPKEAQDILSSYYSDATKYAQKQVKDAKGFANTVETSVRYPSTILTAGIESLAPMGMGAVTGTGVLKYTPKFLKLAPALADKLQKVSPWLTGAIGEGLIAAGSTEEAIRSQTADGLTTLQQGGAAIMSGLGTTAFGIAGGRLANRLHIDDIDTFLARIASDTGEKVTKSGTNAIARMVGGGITEGMFEELPQGMQDQIWMNVALDRPLLEGVPEAAGQSFVVGVAMGGSFAGLAGRGAPNTVGQPEVRTLAKALEDAPLAPTEPLSTKPRLQKALESGQITEATLQGLTTNQEALEDSGLNIEEINIELARLQPVQAPITAPVQERVSAPATPVKQGLMEVGLYDVAKPASEVLDEILSAPMPQQVPAVKYPQVEGFEKEAQKYVVEKNLPKTPEELYGKYQPDVPPYIPAVPEFQPVGIPSTAQQASDVFRTTPTTETQAKTEVRVDRQADLEAALKPENALLPQDLKYALVKMESDLALGETAPSTHDVKTGITTPGKSTSLTWFKKKTVDAYNKANNTNITVTRPIVTKVYEKVRAGQKLATNQVKVWDYIQTVANDMQSTDPEIVAGIEVDKLSGQYNITAPYAVNVESLNSGDKFVVEQEGVPTEVTFNPENYTDFQKIEIISEVISGEQETKTAEAEKVAEGKEAVEKGTEGVDHWISMQAFDVSEGSANIGRQMWESGQIEQAKTFMTPQGETASEMGKTERAVDETPSDVRAEGDRIAKEVTELLPEDEGVRFEAEWQGMYLFTPSGGFWDGQESTLTLDNLNKTELVSGLTAKRKEYTDAEQDTRRPEKADQDGRDDRPGDVREDAGERAGQPDGTGVRGQDEVGRTGVVRRKGEPGGLKVTGEDSHKPDGEKYSKATQPLPASQQANVKHDLEKAIGKKTIRVLTESGKLRIITQAQLQAMDVEGGEIQYSKDGHIEAFYDPRTGVTTMVQGNVRKGTAPQRLAHEVGVHAEALGFKDSDHFQDVLEMLDARRGKNTAEGRAIQEAYKAVPKDTPAANVAEEVLGYLINSSPKITIIRQLIARIKKFLVEKAGFKPEMFKNLDLQALALSAVKSAGREAHVETGVREFAQPVAMASKGEEAKQWYSRLQNLVKDFNVKKQPATAWLNTFNSWKKKKLPPALQEELEWSGVGDALKLMGKRKVTKDEVLALLESGGVQVEEKVLGGEAMADDINYDSKYAIPEVLSLVENNQGQADEALLMALENDSQAYGALMNKFPELAEDEEWGETVLTNITGGTENLDSVTQHHSNVLEGGKNYKELLISLPIDRRMTLPDFTTAHRERFPESKVTDIEIEKMYLSGAELPRTGERTATKVDDHYTPTHFSDTPNLLVHIRFDERTDADGNKVLMIQEIQSDYAKDARESGVKKPSNIVRSLQNKYSNLPTHTGDWSWMILEDAGVSSDEVSEWYDDRMRGKVPDAPFIKSDTAWSMLGMKKAIKYAADNGFDKVAWPSTAEQVYEIEGWGEVIEEDGQFKNRDGAGDVTAIVNRYRKGIVRDSNRFLKSQLKSSEKVQQDELSTGESVNSIDITPFRDDIAMGGVPLFSKRTYTPEQEKSLTKVFGEVKRETLREKVKSARELFGAKARQGLVDQFASFDSILDDKIAWMMAHLTKSSTGATMHLIENGGLFREKSGALDVIEGSKGLKEIFKPLGGEIDDFLKWIAAHRAEKLMLEGRERLMSKDDIRSLKSLGAGQMSDGRDRASVYDNVNREFEALGDSVTRIAVDTGLISRKEADTWEKEGWYVPFYRLLEPGKGAKGPSNINALTRQKGYHKLKGGVSQIDDLLSNTLMNWDHLIGAGLRNQAGSQALKSAEGMGLAVKVPKILKTKDAVFVRDDGREVWYELNDSPEAELVMNSLTSLNYEGIRGITMDVMQWFKRTLTQGTVVSPGFKLRNLIRDTIHAAAVTTVSPNIMANLFTGWTSDTTRMEAGGGGFGKTGYVHGADPTAKKRLVESGVSSSSILDTKSRRKKMWDAWEDFGARLENINRAAGFERDIKAGKTLLEVNFNARDHLDFSRTGSFKAIRFISQTVPFFNARLQGLDKMRRAVEDPVQRKQFIAVVGTYVMASVALYLAMKDDDDFQASEDWEKRTYHMFKVPGTDIMFRLPRPFETGAIAYMIERLTEQFVDNEVGGDVLAKELMHTFGDTFSMNVMPQAVKPLVELYSNKSMFTGRDIESASMQNLSKTERFRDYTSETAKGASKFSGGILSPVQIEHLVRAYTGWAGATALAASDILYQKTVGKITPQEEWYEYEPIKTLVRDATPKNSKYMTQFYDNLAELNRLWGDINKYKGTPEGSKLYHKHISKLVDRAKYVKVQRALSAYRKENSRIYNHKTMTALQKRKAIESNKAKMNALAKSVVSK